MQFLGQPRNKSTARPKMTMVDMRSGLVYT
jgi:hypothetical protein